MWEGLSDGGDRALRNLCVGRTLRFALLCFCSFCCFRFFSWAEPSATLLFLVSLLFLDSLLFLVCLFACLLVIPCLLCFALLLLFLVCFAVPLLFLVCLFACLLVSSLFLVFFCSFCCFRLFSWAEPSAALLFLRHSSFSAFLEGSEPVVLAFLFSS